MVCKILECQKKRGEKEHPHPERSRVGSVSYFILFRKMPNPASPDPRSQTAAGIGISIGDVVKLIKYIDNSDLV